MGIYNILDQIIAEQANTAKEVLSMQENIQAHLNADKNWDELTNKEQTCLIMWEQECEAHPTVRREM